MWRLNKKINRLTHPHHWGGWRNLLTALMYSDSRTPLLPEYTGRSQIFQKAHSLSPPLVFLGIFVNVSCCFCLSLQRNGEKNSKCLCIFNYSSITLLFTNSFLLFQKKRQAYESNLMRNGLQLEATKSVRVFLFFKSMNVLKCILLTWFLYKN